MGLKQVRRGARSIDTGGNRLATRSYIEGREFVSAIAYDGDSFSLEYFQCTRNVENAFRAGTDDSDIGAGQLAYIGRDIPGVCRVAPMSAADAARCEQADTSSLGKVHRRCHGG